MGAARLRSLSVRDFRNLERVELTLPDEGVIVIGDNGQGKTNLLEAIYYLELLRSARGARDVDLVRFGQEAFHLAATVETDALHQVAVGFERAGRHKRVRLDGGIVPRLADAVGALPAVLFSPADVELIAGAPGARRRFLDIVLALTVPGYLAALQRYRGALQRRNAALRDLARSGARVADQRVAVWEPPLAEAGATLWRARHAWVERVASRFAQLCAGIGEQAAVTMSYTTAVEDTGDLAGALADALASRRATDLRRGMTQAGPHRDDLTVTIADASGAPRELGAFGSAGQHRTAAIALRLLEAESLRERGGPNGAGATPVFLMDDPFAELDVRRSERILALLEETGLGQTVLAVPRESDIPPGMRRLTRLRMRAGCLTPWSAA